jgi:hypothetical protein
MRPARWNLCARSAAVAALLVAGVGAAPAEVAAHTPGAPRWTAETLYVHDETGRPEVAHAVGSWDHLSRLHLAATATPCTSGEACIEVGVRALNPTLGGWATWHTANGAITACTVTINATPAYPLTMAQRDDVALHELGHCLGLGHSAQRPSVMDETVEPLTGPTNVDGEALRALYGA